MTLEKRTKRLEEKMLKITAKAVPVCASGETDDLMKLIPDYVDLVKESLELSRATARTLDLINHKINWLCQNMVEE